MKIKLKSGFLSIGEISSEKELTELEQLTETPQDSNRPLKIKPTKKQFKEFLKKNGFSSGDVFTKVQHPQ